VGIEAVKGTARGSGALKPSLVGQKPEERIEELVSKLKMGSKQGGI